MFENRIAQLESEHDRKLAKEAVEVPYIWWGLIEPEKAETEEGRKLLKDIRTHKFHTEEYYSGTL